MAGLRGFFSLVKAGFEKAFKTSRATLRHVLIFMLVFGLERIFEKDVFKCPNGNYYLYGMLFLSCPALSLFVLTLLLNVKFWEVLTGCRLSHFKRSFVFKRATSMVFQALLPPGVWIVVALIQTNYYVCAKLGPKDTAIRKATRNTTDARKIKEIKYNIERLFNKAQTESHIIAWGVFITLIVLAFVAVCIRRCLFLEADGILPDLNDYQKLEAEAAVEHFKENIEKIAKKEGEKSVTVFLEESINKMPNSAYSQVEYVKIELSKKYPRTTGDLSKPYRVDRTAQELNGNDRITHDSQV